MAAIKHLFMISGEPSGELLAAGLTRAIRELNPSIKISAVGGQLLRQAGATVLYDTRGLAVIGLFDVLKKLPRFISLKKLILAKIAAEKPDGIILVDFSGLNLRLAKAINKKIPVIYYVSPQVWASRCGRVKTIKKYVSKMVVLFEFEKEFYQRYGIDAEFGGHPLLDIVKPTLSKKEFCNTFNLKEDRPTLALLPGSRRQEVNKILPIMLQACLRIKKEIPNLQLLIAKVPQLEGDIYQDKLKELNLEAGIVQGKTYDCLNAADFALVCSGTATLETAILAKPFAVIYKMNWLNFLFYLPQVKVPYIALANIVAGKKLVQEFIQSQATPAKIAREVLRMLKSPNELQKLHHELSGVSNLLGEKGASQRAARIILNFLQN